MNKVTKYLNERIGGNVFDRPSILTAYSRDHSVIEVTPRFVAIPTSTSDIQTLVANAREFSRRGFHLPISVRGSGFSKTGADLSEGLVISLEKLNHVMEIDENSRLVRVQAGITLGQLKAVLSAYNLTLPIDANPAETISDLIAGFTLDGLASKHKSLLNYIECIEVILSSGDIIHTEMLSSRSLQKKSAGSTFANAVYSRTAALLNQKFDIVEDIAKAPRDFVGYSMVAKVQNGHHFDLAPLFFGAEHTLGIITEVILRVTPILRPAECLLASFKDQNSAQLFAASLTEYNPASATLFDSKVVRLAAIHGKKPAIINPENHNYFVLAAFDDRHSVNKRRIKKLIESSPFVSEFTTETPENTADFDCLPSLFTQFLNDETSAPRPAILDDVYIPTADLADFLSELSTLEATFDREMPVIGSVTTGLYSVRPYFDLTSLDDRKNLVKFLKSYSALVRSHHGSLTGGSSEGRIKGALTKLDPRTEAFFTEIKQIFDPENILNPEAKTGATIADIIRHLRTDCDFGIVVK